MTKLLTTYSESAGCECVNEIIAYLQTILEIYFQEKKFNNDFFVDTALINRVNNDKNIQVRNLAGTIMDLYLAMKLNNSCAKQEEDLSIGTFLNKQFME